VKPQEIAKRDFMIWDFTVKPVQARLRTTAASLAGAIALSAVVFHAISPSPLSTGAHD
jgi:hypothetical protein